MAFVAQSTASAVAPRPDPRTDWRIVDGALSWFEPSCGKSQEQTINLGRNVLRVDVRSPKVGDRVRGDNGDVGTVTAAALREEGGRTRLAVSIVGDGSLPQSPDDNSNTISNWLVRIANRASIECQIASLKDPRSDAFRCLVADPCFVSPIDPDRLLCVASPWSRTGTLVNSQDYPDPNRGIFGVPGPWALELGRGLRCSWLSGGTWVRANRRLNYGCWRKGRVGRPAAFLYGKVRNGTILKARSADAPLRRVRVRTMWN